MLSGAFAPLPLRCWEREFLVRTRKSSCTVRSKTPEDAISTATPRTRAPAFDDSARESSITVPKMTSASAQAVAEYTVADTLVEALTELGVEHAFGIIGGAIAPFCKAVSRSRIRLIHARHETGAASPRWKRPWRREAHRRVRDHRPRAHEQPHGHGDGAHRGGEGLARHRYDVGGAARSRRVQETDGTASALAPLFTPGAIFHHAVLVEDPRELDAFIARLASGVARPNGFVAHLGLPLAVQTARRAERTTPAARSAPPPVCDAATVARLAALLASEPFVIWAGFGARHAVRPSARSPSSPARASWLPRARRASCPSIIRNTSA